MRKIMNIVLLVLLVSSLSACSSVDTSMQDLKIKELEEQISSLQSELDEKSSSSLTQGNSNSAAESYSSSPSYSLSSKSSVQFTNKYGTATTKCYETNCSNYIASSGDTNCCITHSNNCIECSSYIDGDAAFCISCIEKAANQIKQGD